MPLLYPGLGCSGILSRGKCGPHGLSRAILRSSHGRDHPCVSFDSTPGLETAEKQEQREGPSWLSASKSPIYSKSHPQIPPLSGLVNT